MRLLFADVSDIKIISGVTVNAKLAKLHSERNA